MYKSLEEVREHFKNATKVECIYGGKYSLTSDDLDRIERSGVYVVYEDKESTDAVYLYGGSIESSFAKILESKCSHKNPEIAKMLDAMKYNVGDTIACEGRNKRMILAKVDLIYILSNPFNFKSAASYYTQDDLDRNGWFLSVEKKEEERVKLTISDIAKLKGVDSSLIDIVE